MITHHHISAPLGKIPGAILLLEVTETPGAASDWANLEAEKIAEWLSDNVSVALCRALSRRLLDKLTST